MQLFSRRSYLLKRLKLVMINKQAKSLAYCKKCLVLVCFIVSDDDVNTTITDATFILIKDSSGALCIYTEVQNVALLKHYGKSGENLLFHIH